MACHETKNCPRCHAPFECKPGNVQECQCAGIAFSEAEKYYISSNYEDCLCRNCLLAIRYEMRYNPAAQQMKAILSATKAK